MFVDHGPRTRASVFLCLALFDLIGDRDGADDEGAAVFLCEEGWEAAERHVRNGGVAEPRDGAEVAVMTGPVGRESWGGWAGEDDWSRMSPA